jgi:DNA polymerase
MDDAGALIRWYLDAGVDEAIGEAPIDRTLPPPAPVPRAILASSPAAAPAPVSRPSVSTSSALAPSVAAQDARSIAAQATNVAALRRALETFEGCALRRTATNLVFTDGVEDAPLLVVGEAPGADEDRTGRPFVGVSGQLLDRMLAAIGHERKSNALISNVVFWRPPGNRKPTTEEIAICLPFVERLIALVSPKVLLLAGATPTTALLRRSDPVGRIRGRWIDWTPTGASRSIATLATYHPAYLLRQPLAKREAWKDLLTVKARLAAEPR